MVVAAAVPADGLLAADRPDPDDDHQHDDDQFDHTVDDHNDVHQHHDEHLARCERDLDDVHQSAAHQLVDHDHIGPDDDIDDIQLAVVDDNDINIHDDLDTDHYDDFGGGGHDDRPRGAGGRIASIGMSDSSTQTDGLTEVINLLAAPIASGLRSMEQMRRGVDEMWRAVENLNTTMENLNETAMRVNRLLEEVEEPVKVMIPQLTRTVKAADEMTQRLEAPVKAAAPNIERIVDTLSQPGFAALPGQLSEVLSTVGDVSRRLGPLASLAENAGGLFGGLRFPGTGGGATAPTDQPRPASSQSEPSTPSLTTVTEKTASPPAKKKAAAKKKRAAKKKAAAKKQAAAKKTS